MKRINRMKLYIGVSNILMISETVDRTLSLMWLIIGVITILFVVGIVPDCRKYENIWLFILTAIGTIPINISITRRMISLGLFDSGIPVVGVVIASIEIYLLLLTIEELFIGVIGRVIWKQQKCLDEDI